MYRFEIKNTDNYKFIDGEGGFKKKSKCGN